MKKFTFYFTFLLIFSITSLLFFSEKKSAKSSLNASQETNEDISKNYQRPSKEQRAEGRGELEFIYTHDPETQSIPKERLIDAKEYTNQLLNNRASIPNVVWEERGPNNVAGRTRAI